MTESLEEMWNRLSLTEEEQSEVVVEREWVDDGAEVGNKCLLGKLLLRRAFNTEAMRLVFLKIWRIKSGMTIREVGERLFLFYFEDALERDKAFQKQPWSFNKSLLVLNEFDGHTHPETVNMEWCPFNVQIHGLPFDMMTKKIGTILGEAIGDVEEVDSDESQMAWGRWLKVRVAINVSKPLKRGKVLSVPGNGKALAMFRYERLPDFCYICGILDHQEQDCDKAVQLKKEGKKANREYGTWLRAEGPTFNTYKTGMADSRSVGESFSSLPTNQKGKQKISLKENVASSGEKHTNTRKSGEKPNVSTRGIQEMSQGAENHGRPREERTEVHGGKEVESNPKKCSTQHSPPCMLSKECVSTPKKGVDELVKNWDRVDLIQNSRKNNGLTTVEVNGENVPTNNNTNMNTRNKKQPS